MLSVLSNEDKEKPSVKDTHRAADSGSSFQIGTDLGSFNRQAVTVEDTGKWRIRI